MPRVARIVVAGCPHHVTQRGNNRQDVFFVDDDRHYYLHLLREHSARHGLAIEAYCLMTNHVHLIATPSAAEALTETMRRVNQFYTQYINRLHCRTGHLWQDRFFSCGMDEPHAWRAMIYVERNPARAGLVRRAWRWPWSSAAAHCGGEDKAGLLDLPSWRKRLGEQDWRETLTRAQDDEEIRRIRLCTTRGRPLGSDSFVSKLERLAGRRLRPLPEGRPWKNKGKNN